MATYRGTTRRRLTIAGFAIAICALTVWQVEATKQKKTPKPKSVSLKGVVTDSHNRPLSGATVFVIDSTTLNRPADILSGVSEAYDEPLEDIVNNPDLLKSLKVKQAKTDAAGKFSTKGLISTSTYY